MAEAERPTDSSGISYQDLIASDAVPPRWPLTEVNRYTGDQVTVPIARYVDRSYHELEMTHLWPRVWQMTCREEQIADVGDFHVYEIGRFSIIIVRTAEGLRAHHNVCRHRGRKLCDAHQGHAASFICPFHGFSWNLDGSNRSVTSDWDFPHVDRSDFALTAVQVDTWGGWVFINMDVQAPPLAEHLGALPDHFRDWQPEARYLQAWCAKVLPTNWKVTQEAFMEAFHVITTHPQILEGTGDENSQYDAWDTFSRAITPNGTPSPHLKRQPSEQALFDAVTMRYLNQGSLAEIPEGTTARAVLGASMRQRWGGCFEDGKAITDAEANDSIYYTLFPNFHPWGGLNGINYRFRPYGDRHDACVMECFYLAPFNGERPPPAAMHWLDVDDDWTEASELGILAKVFQQDAFNLPQVQAGLEAAQFDSITLARYQETKLRHFHVLLSEWVDARGA